MTDIALAYIDGLIDMDLGDGGAAEDESLRTAIIVSLFSDRLAEEADELPDGGTDRRGWWGDVHPEVDGDRIGSRLWLLGREKQLSSVLGRAETYAAEALQWLIDDGIVADLTVSATNPADGALALSIRIRSRAGSEVVYTARAAAGASGTDGDIITDEAYGLVLDDSGAPILA